MAFTEDELKTIAAQLRCPSGDMGTEVAKNMNVSNAAMINSTLNLLKPVGSEQILELGPGNGLHIKQLLAENAAITYTALDISEDMIAQASANLSGHNVEIVHYDGTHIPLAENTFHKAFTVNTIYFWEDPAALLSELKRVLKPGGLLYITFGDGNFMKNNLPFTKYGFSFYQAGDVVKLLTENGFEIINQLKAEDNVSRNSDEVLMRPYYVITSKNIKS